MKISWIEKGVLAGSGVPIGVDDLNSLKEQGIGAIVTLTEQSLTMQRPITMVTVTEHSVTTQSPITSENIEQLDLAYLHAPISDDNPPDEATAESIINFIDEMAAQGRATLVHCFAGKGRTGTMLHAYYLAHGDDLETAKQKVKASRPVCAFIMLSDPQREFLISLAAKR